MFKIRFVVAIMTMLFIIRISFLEIDLGNLYFLIIGLGLIPLLISSKILKINFLVLWIIFASVLSIFVNDIPAVFRPYERLLAFILVIMLVGPFLSSNSLNSFKLSLFKVVNKYIVILVLLSFVGLSIRIPFVYGRTGFNGLFNHSMTLGPMAALSMLTSVNWRYSSSNKKLRHLYLAFAIISFLTCLMAGSRGALVGALAGLLFYLYKINKKYFLSLAGKIILIIALLFVTFPLWEKYTERLVEKNDYAEDQGDVAASRAGLWDLRIKEFNSSPLFGIGFSSVDTSGNTDNSGKIEPGSSWLVILSMTGLFGFIPFLLLNLGYLKNIFKETERVYIGYLGGIFFFFVFHLIVEGYVLSAGSAMFFYFWLFLGIIEIQKIKK